MTEAALTYRDMRALVVEDNEFMRELVVGLVRQIGFGTVASAPDGEQGLHEIMGGRPQIIICDINMQPVDGVEFVKRLRSAGFFGTNKIPTIFPTTHATEDFVRKARDLDVDGYLVKPVTRTHLEQRIAKILGDPRRMVPGSSPVR